MNDTTNDHAWFREQLAAYTAGGLEGEELARFESHANQCAACAAELKAFTDADHRLTNLFASTRPAPGFEDRLIQSLRQSRSNRMFLHPAIRRAVTGVAAAVVLGTFGYVVNQSIHQGDLPSVVAIAQRVKSGANLRQIGQAMLLYENETKTPVARLAVPAQEMLGSNRYTSVGKININTASEKELNHLTLEGAFKTNGTNLDYSGGHFYFNTSPSGGEKNSVGHAVTINGGTRGNDGNGRESQHGAELGDATVDGFLAGKSIVKKGAGTLTLSGKNNFGGRAIETAARGEQWFKPTQLADGARGVSQFWDVDSDGKDKSREVHAGVVNKSPVPAYVAALVAQAEPNAPAAPQEQQAPAVSNRKIIRNGTLEFEVDRFDTAFSTISQLVREAGGYVGTTQSEKLPNGKVRGSVTVRVPPDQLDKLALQLRGIGDLKSQKLEAQDVSKQYSDLESELKADRAMEERLLEIIKSGKGEIKDLLAAEKELAVWRGKIEKIMGEIKFFDNQVALSTLNITVYEKDIKTPAAITETETMDAGVETVDVEKARIDALKAIESAKGRVIQSDLKRFDAGQFGATIVAEVAPDAAGPLLDRIKQIGKVARLDIQRHQTSDGSASTAGSRIDRKDTRINLSLYNLANVAPRQTAAVDLAAEDVETAYRAVLGFVDQFGGQVVTSNLNRQRPEQTTGTISLEIPSDKADAASQQLKTLGEVIKFALSENPDTANVTAAKRGYTVQVVSSAAIAPRQSTTLGIEVSDVEASMNTLQKSIADAGGRVAQSNLAREQDGRTVGKVTADVPLAKASELVNQARNLGTVRVIESNKDNNAPEGSLAKARLDITFGSSGAIVSGDRGVWTAIREGLSTSATGLLWSIEMIVVGLCFVIPWGLLIWGGWKLFRRSRTKTLPAAT